MQEEEQEAEPVSASAVKTGVETPLGMTVVEELIQNQTHKKCPIVILYVCQSVSEQIRRVMKSYGVPFQEH